MKKNNNMSENQNKVVLTGTVINVDMKNEKYPKYTVKESGNAEYPMTITFDCNSSKIQTLPLKGDNVEMSGYVGSREWNGRYFTGVSCVYCKVLEKHKTIVPESVNTAGQFAENDEVPF